MACKKKKNSILGTETVRSLRKLKHHKFSSAFLSSECRIYGGDSAPLQSCQELKQVGGGERGVQWRRRAGGEGGGGGGDIPLTGASRGRTNLRLLSEENLGLAARGILRKERLR